MNLPTSNCLNCTLVSCEDDETLDVGILCEIRTPCRQKLLTKNTLQNILSLFRAWLVK